MLAFQGQGPTQPISPTSDAAQGLINLDVVVTDNSGKRIPRLGPKDFTLLDNDQPQKIISFHSFDGISSQPDPPVEVILVVDTIKMPDYLASFEREEVERFLRRNGGHLGQPVSIFGLSDAGFWTLTSLPATGTCWPRKSLATASSLSAASSLLGNGTGETRRPGSCRLARFEGTRLHCHG